MSVVAGDVDDVARSLTDHHRRDRATAQPRTFDVFAPKSAASASLMGVPWLEPWDISRMVLFLASEESRYVTGASFSIDAGMAVM
jgi:NAD(P)-dependent dehydrogenase (short-subunit alcohol dehydrogenase family)